MFASQKLTFPILHTFAGLLQSRCPRSTGRNPWRTSEQDHLLDARFHARLPQPKILQEVARTEVSSLYYLVSPLPNRQEVLNLMIFLKNSRRLALIAVQRNLRNYMKLRTWAWWKMWTRVKPLLNVTQIEDEIKVRLQPRWLHIQWRVILGPY